MGSFGIIHNLSNGHDLLKLMKASSMSTLTGISIHASTFYAPPFSSWAAEGPSLLMQAKLAVMLALHSGHCNSLSCPDKHFKFLKFIA